MSLFKVYWMIQPLHPFSRICLKISSIRFFHSAYWVLAGYHTMDFGFLCVDNFRYTVLFHWSLLTHVGHNSGGNRVKNGTEIWPYRHKDDMTEDGLYSKKSTAKKWVGEVVKVVRTVRYVVTHTPRSLQVECKLYLKSAMQSKNKFDTVTAVLGLLNAVNAERWRLTKRKNFRNPLQTSRGI